MQLEILRLDPAAIVPVRAYDADAGLDLHALEPVELAPGTRAQVRTGIAIALPPGHAGLVLPRSGLAARHGIALVNAPGLIDEGYRGEVQVLLLNTDRDDTARIAAGDRIAQLVVVAVATPAVVEVAELGDSERGERGFGSSGVAAAG
jgi:dUTP pyrophosphatase